MIETNFSFHVIDQYVGYSKYFLEALGHEGLNKMLDGFDDRSAEAVCTFAFSNGPGEEPLIFQGRTVVCQSFLARFKRAGSPMILLANCTSSLTKEYRLSAGENRIRSRAAKLR
jgi:hypothetical protein